MSCKFNVNSTILLHIGILFLSLCCLQQNTQSCLLLICNLSVKFEFKISKCKYVSPVKFAPFNKRNPQFDSPNNSLQLPVVVAGKLILIPIFTVFFSPGSNLSFCGEYNTNTLFSKSFGLLVFL